MLRLSAAALTAVMFALKLMGDFDHSWWVVFSPLIGYIAFVTLLVVIAAIFSSK